MTQPLLADREFEELIDTRLWRSAMKQRAMRRLRRMMDNAGNVTLRGGVRGWAEALGCGLSRPRALLDELAADELIALDIVRESGGWLAQITVLAAFGRPDRSGINAEADEHAAAPERLEAHQDAETRASPIDPGSIPPCTPHVVHDSDSEQQQHGAHTVSSDDREGDTGGEAMVRRLWRENAYEQFPRAERAAIDFLFADRFNDPMAIWRWLDAEPTMTLARARRQLVNAATRDDFERHRGAAIAAGQRAGEIAPGRRRGEFRQRVERAVERQQPPAPSEPEPPSAAVSTPHLVDMPPEPPPPRLSTEERERAKQLQYAFGTLQAAGHWSSSQLLGWRLHQAVLTDLADGVAVVAVPKLHATSPPPRVLEAFRRAIRDAFRALGVGRVELVDPAALAAAAD